MMRSSLAGALLAVWMVGCGGGGLSPGEACEELAETTCARLFECFTDAEREAANLPPTEAACVTQLEQAGGCDEVTEDNICEANQTYNADRAEDCLDQLAALDCGQVRDGIEESEVPACQETCEVE